MHEDGVDERFIGDEFAAYVEKLFAVESTPDGFETIDEVVTVEKDGEETAWGWWRTLATPAEEAGLVKARPDGAYLERVAYYTVLTR